MAGEDEDGWGGDLDRAAGARVGQLGDRDLDRPCTVTSTHRYPNREQEAPSVLTAEAHETIKVRTARP